MLSQKEFVEGCYNWYREADLQPGNPEDGEWDAAHYPVPSCKGGTETILLLREHHAIQGVIQCEEYQWKCIWGWEEKYLSGEYLELFKKWRSEGSRLIQATRTEEEKILTAEKMRAIALARPANSQPPHTNAAKQQIGEKNKAHWARLTEEEKILRSEKMRAGWARMTEEEKILLAEKKSANSLALQARLRFEREVDDLVAVWQMGLRWG